MSKITACDDGDEEFASCLQRKNVLTISVTPNGEVMKEHDSIAQRVSFIIARLHHPLIKRKDKNDMHQ